MKKRHVLGVIPARMGSTRLRRKMVLLIDGKPLIYYTWKQAKKAKNLDEVLIATDNKEIYNIAKSFGAEVVMTSKKINCGSDRVASAAKKFSGFKPEIVVNIQGDEPLIPVAAIDRSVKALLADDIAVISTPATPFTNLADQNSPNFVKVVLDKDDYALYFSRSLIPYPRVDHKKYLKHLGLYAFKADFLQTYIKLAQTPLEKAESLEQLRVLENGYKIKVVVGFFKNLEVNTPEELARVKRIIEEKL